jgi:hypothetical protein
MDFVDLEFLELGCLARKKWSGAIFVDLELRGALPNTPLVSQSVIAAAAGLATRPLFELVPVPVPAAAVRTTTLLHQVSRSHGRNEHGILHINAPRSEWGAPHRAVGPDCQLRRSRCCCCVPVCVTLTTGTEGGRTQGGGWSPGPGEREREAVQ